MPANHSDCRYAIRGDRVPVAGTGYYTNTETNIRLQLGLPRVLEYSLLSISGRKFPFLVAVFSSASMNCWNLWKLGASRLHLQIASLVS